MVLVRRRWCAWGLGAGAAVALARWWAPLTAALPLLGLVALARAAAAGAATWLAAALPRRPLRDLRRRAVLITGCDSGFGHEAALRLHALGAPVLAGVLLPQGPGAARLRQLDSPRMRVLPLDVTDDASVAEARRAVDRILREGDCELWAVVNNAGILAVGEAEWMEMKDVKKCMDVNAFGQVRVTKAFLPLLKKSKGRVININSQASTIVAPTINPYTMSKFASLAYTDSLRYDMQKFSISVHSIEPAMYRTPLVQSAMSVCPFNSPVCCPIMLRFAAILLLAAAAQARVFTFQNRLSQTIWVGSLGNAGLSPIDGGGWEMAPGSTVTKNVPDNWAGRFWARTGCNFDAAGNGGCVVGDCGRGLKCNGAGGIPPVTLVEMTLQGWAGLDYYDVSNVDGFNVPASMTPTDQSGSGYSCTSANCNRDIDAICPGELQVVSNGRVVACKSACLAFNSDYYCCRGAYNTPATCQSSTWPVNYPKIFKDACPQAYSYAYDDVASTFTCSNTNYRIVFGA